MYDYNMGEIRKNRLKIVEKFDIHGVPVGIEPLGNGLINKTFRVRTAGDTTPDYVLQQINHQIFKDVEGLQNNIRIVTDHLRNKLMERGVGDLSRRVLTFLPLKDSPDNTFFHDGHGYWRLSEFIEDSFTKTEITPESAYDTGRAFGRFQADLADLKVPLVETIPDFHNIEFRIGQLREAVANPVEERLAGCNELVEALLDDAEEMCVTERLFRDGRLAKRVCHCDTKVNNVLFDRDGNVLCVIDLDTVMPSFVFSDYGDFIRTAAVNLPEDSEATTDLRFNMEVFRAFTEGYLSESKEFLTPTEIDYLPHAVALFPYMQSVRFITDYLNGDTYYKTDYPEHNLVRARNQLELYRLVRAIEPELRRIIVASSQP